ncbi:MAG TPA: hypothetical protein VFT22_19665, partial [Kofleriaceae bacterium]|nr:hypothetical protein [Kofleriaceae bacterium]
FALQYAGTGLILPFYLILFNALSYRGFSQEAVIALILGLIVLGFSIAMLARLDEQDSAGARWTLLAVPAALELIYAFIYILVIRKGGGRYNRLFAALFVLHVVITLLNVAYLAIKTVSNDLRDGGGAGFGWWALYAFVGAPLLVLGVPALILNALGSYSLDTGALSPFLSAPRFAQLFDDATLVSDPGVVSPTLAQHYYPPGDADGPRRMRRKLVSLWWHGGTKDLYVRSRGDRLELTWVAQGAAAPAATVAATQVAELPQAAMRIGVFAGMLGLVREPAGPGVLEVRVELPEGEDHLLPEGRVLALGFEDDLTRAQAARLAAGDAWTKVEDHPPQPPPDPETGVVPPVTDPGFPIYFTTKSRLAVALGARGEAIDPDEPAGVVTAATGTIAQDVAGPVFVLGTGTRFVKELAGGDLIQVGANQAVIDQIIDDTHLVVSSPATWLPAPAGPAVAFSRVSDDRRFDRAGAGTALTHAGAAAVPLPVPFPPAVSALPLVIGSGTAFDQLFGTGDVIRVVAASGVQERTVVRVLSATAMQIDSAFSSAIDAGGGSPFVRVGRHGVEGKRLFATAATDLFSGGSAMDDAADLAALLCLGGVSHVLTEDERKPVAGTTTRFPGSAPIARVYQCLRNWNLDRRRVNEWKMLVAGGAVSEKRGRPIVEPESMMIPPEDGYNPVNPGGEAVALELGWVGLLRRWMDVARRAGVDALATTPLVPGDPSNLALSRGIAFLLDLPDPAPGVDG